MKIAKALVFDFGGTLDIDGVHWYDLWREAYTAAGLQVDEKALGAAYAYAEETLNQAGALDMQYRSLIRRKADLQLRSLYPRRYDEDPLLQTAAETVSNFCYKKVLGGARKSFHVLDSLRHPYPKAVVSNFYGNLRIILKELHLLDFFSVIIDSKIENIRKPDPQIYLLAVRRLGVRPEDCIFIGDSYPQDIVPSKELGFRTIMIRKKNEDLSVYTKADFIIHSVEQLADYL